MTLICTHLGGSSGFLAVSDILLTAKGDAPLPTALPLRQRPIFHSVRGISLAGAAQKSVIFGRTLVSWSGPKFVAEKVLRYIASASGSGEREVTRLEVAQNAGVPHDEAHQVRLIYHYTKPNGDISVWAWRCEQKQIGNTNAIFAGSGGPVYTEGTDVQAPNNDQAEDDVTAILARSIGLLVSEVTSNDTLDQHFGGWIEITVRRGDYFDKIEYAVKLWYLKNNKSEYSPGPLLFNFYRHKSLVIAKFSYETLGDQKERELFIINDFFGRNAPTPDDGPNVVFDPMSIFHVVIDTEGDYVDVFMTAGDNLGYEVAIDKDFNVEETIAPRFWDIITGKSPSAGIWSVS